MAPKCYLDICNKIRDKISGYCIECCNYFCCNHQPVEKHSCINKKDKIIQSESSDEESN